MVRPQKPGAIEHPRYTAPKTIFSHVVTVSVTLNSRSTMRVHKTPGALIRSVKFLANDKDAFAALAMGMSGCTPYGDGQMAHERDHLERAKRELLGLYAWLSKADE